MEFEFDPVKSASNKKKHGIDFTEAQELWNDGNARLLDARSEEEPRLFLFALRHAAYWTVIFTMRNDRIRIISARKSRNEEKQIYDQGD